eukprot:SAG31_NODE_2482_length_5634_cov_1.887805_8_plen_130_part_00
MLLAQVDQQDPASRDGSESGLEALTVYNEEDDHEEYTLDGLGVRGLGATAEDDQQQGTDDMDTGETDGIHNHDGLDEEDHDESTMAASDADDEEDSEEDSEDEEDNSDDSDEEEEEESPAVLRRSTRRR